MDIEKIAKDTKGSCLNKVVEIAMQSFTRVVGERGGITRALDKSTAIDMFETLHAGGELFDAPEIVKWLETERDWQGIHAQSVGDVAQKVIDGKRQPCTRRIYGDIGLAHWRKLAAKEASPSK
jgi:hypothetical protein